jgi:PEP-CTERM motif
MKLRQLACVAALAVVGAGAQASTTSLYSFSLGAPTSVVLTASAGSGNLIQSFDVLMTPPTFETQGATSWGLAFVPLGAGMYTVQLVTTLSSPVYVAATVNGTTTVQLSPVPEPESMALALAGLGVAGMVLRRRSLASV